MRPLPCAANLLLLLHICITIAYNAADELDVLMLDDAGLGDRGRGLMKEDAAHVKTDTRTSVQQHVRANICY